MSTDSNLAKKNIRERHKAIAAMIREDIAPSEILEIGPNYYPLIPGSDTIDQYVYCNPSYVHNVKAIPWPIQRRYKLIVALQVFEHLGQSQRQVFEEMKRVGDNAVLSIPWKWKTTKTESLIESHCGINDRVIANWTGDYPTALNKILKPENGGGEVIVKGYSFNGQKGVFKNASEG